MKQKLLLFLGCMLMVVGMRAEDSYSYTFTAKQFSANGTIALNNVDWTLDGNGGYWGYEGTKGQQFGSAGAPYKTMTLSTSGIPGTITKIVINTSGASDIKGTATIKVGETEFGTITLTKTATEYTFEGSAEGNVEISYTQTSSKAIYIKSIKITYVIESYVAAPGLPESCNFTESEKSIEIINNDSEATVYYTTDDSEFTTENWTKYENAFKISETTTVRAIAVNENEASEIAEATYTKVEAMSIAEAKEAYDKAGDAQVFINLENAVVTVNKGDYLFIQDGTTGINLYKSGATYVVGTKFTQGILAGTSSAYNKMHQITNAEFTDVETTTVEVAPIAVTVAQLNADYATYEGRYVKLTDVKLAGTTITQGEDSYAAYDRFGIGFESQYPTATACDIEGVVACHGDKLLQIFPVVITVKEAVLPQVSPAGGESSEEALTVEQGAEIMIVPAENNTVTYSINEAEAIAIAEATTITAENLGVMKLVVTSAFGGSSKTATYYYNVVAVTPKITARLTREEIESTTKTAGYSATALVNSSIGLWSGHMAVNYQYAPNIQINKKEGYHIQSPVFPGRVISVAVTFNASTSQSSARGFVVMRSSFDGESASEATEGCLGSASYEGKDNPTATTAELTGDVTSFKIYATGGAIYVAGIEVVYEKPKDHTLTVGETGWATLYLGLDATIPTGVECYTVTSAANGVATLSLVEKNLPAHMGVVVKANANTSHTFAYKSTYAGKGAIENLLQGSIVDAEITGNGYVLSAPEGVVGLYAAKLTDGKFLNNANKAYLPASAVASNAPMFSFSRGGDEEDTTGIEYSSPLNSMPSTAIYDLTGRRVEKMEKGIYIVNGKKVIR